MRLIPGRCTGATCASAYNERLRVTYQPPHGPYSLVSSHVSHSALFSHGGAKPPPPRCRLGWEKSIEGPLIRASVTLTALHIEA